MATNQENKQDLELRESRLTAFALGQLDDQQRLQVEKELRTDESAQRTVAEVRQLSQALRHATEQETLPPASTELRETIMNRLDSNKSVEPVKSLPAASASRGRMWLTLAAAICLSIVAVPVAYLMMRQGAKDEAVATKSNGDGEMSSRTLEKNSGDPGELVHASDESGSMAAPGPEYNAHSTGADSDQAITRFDVEEPRAEGEKSAPGSGRRLGGYDLSGPSGAESGAAGPPANFTAPRAADPFGGGAAPAKSEISDSSYGSRGGAEPAGAYGASTTDTEALRDAYDEGGYGAEQYDEIVENSFLPVNEQHARSTFSIDVDTASYANVRRFLTRNTLPPPDAVRIEEMINYFSYDYPQPEGDIPFSVNMEVAEAPWKPSNRLLRIGLKGLELDRDERPASNIVFLLDTSGSMRSHDKLPLLQQAMKMLVRELTENDMITIVTYAGNAGLRLDATPGDQQETIVQAIDSLSAGGSTHGSAGIMLAYQKAVESFIDEGTNRVILATDGDLNVGITRDDALVNLIQEKAQSGVFLTVLGFGTGNLKDSKMEKLADNGNGVYAYIDSTREARKVLVEQIAGSLVTIAKDVKIQIEFNPAEVQSYRLIGYENRLLAREDFDDDTKDAGEIGAGHTVTALYELVPAGADVKEERGTGELKYQKADKSQETDPEDLTDAAGSGELLTLWLRYKQPDGDKSRRLEFTLKDGGQKFNRASQDYQFAAAVAGFGMMLRGSEHAGSMSYSAIEEIASSAAGKDLKGYRTEFLDLVRKASQLQR